ncbi:GNAT family N-acetyltransferase [Pseudogemmobacter bohemicus]|uniref:GNAT family N-acetyltransferase n=1 Tax=Pseudogemmobacter bohemicus TaxID=2250708 RepID=UPI000DD2E3E4|nr:N-acetyltransferase [Pseudogemmobacter bohemicus]
MQIRDETTGDHGAIAALITLAFREAPHRDGNEAALVGRLRDSDALILSLVAEVAGQIIGHIAASPCGIGGQSGFALIAPVSVLPGFQGKRVGSGLMEAALGRLRDAGYPGAALVGDPGYYGRFGFASRDGLGCAGIPPDYVLSRGLTGSAPAGLLGLHPAFTA